MSGTYNGKKQFVELPSEEVMYKVVMRDLEVTNLDTAEENEQATQYMKFVFEWYVRVLLPCFALKENFGEKYHGAGPVSFQHMDNNPKKYRVPPSTEAFALISYENCRSRWTNLYQWHLIPANNKESLPRYKAKETWTHQFKGKYSDSARGVCRFGGWSNAGKSRFYDLAKQINTLREEKPDMLKKIDSIVSDKAFKELQEGKKDGEDGKPAAKKARINGPEVAEEEDYEYSDEE